MKIPFAPTTTASTLTLLSVVVTTTRADIVLENDLIVADEIYDLKYALDSDVSWTTPNTTKYYCVFRSLWTPDDHPNEFPDLARMSSPSVFSHTKQFSPFLKNRDANYGVEIIAEVSFSFLLTCVCDCILDTSLYTLSYVEIVSNYVERLYR